MTNQEAIGELSALMTRQPDYAVALDKAISALQAQEIRDLLPVSPLLDKKKKKRKREAISAPQPQELSKNSTELDKENGDLHPTCTGSCTGSEELKQEAKNSKESSSTHKALDTISRQAAINTVKKHYRVDNDLLEVIVYQLENLPSAQPDVPDTNVGDIINRQAAIDVLCTENCNEEGRWCDDGDCSAVRRLKALPSAQPEIIHCCDCIYYDPEHIEKNGVRYEYKDMPKAAFVLETGLVESEYGINVGGKCCRDYNVGYSEDKRVFVSKQNYCGRARRRQDE